MVQWRLMIKIDGDKACQLRCLERRANNAKVMSSILLRASCHANCYFAQVFQYVQLVILVFRTNLRVALKYNILYMYKPGQLSRQSMRLLISGSWVRAPRWAKLFKNVSFTVRSRNNLLYGSPNLSISIILDTAMDLRVLKLYLDGTL